MHTLRPLLLWSLMLAFAGSSYASCPDLNGYVAYKDQGQTDSYTLNVGTLEMGGQTYLNDHIGRLLSVRIYGNNPNSQAVQLLVKVHDVDANNRPTTVLAQNQMLWYPFDNAQGYKDIVLSGGLVYLQGNFAISVEIKNQVGYAATFELDYTGDGEGQGEDLASIGGTNTQWIWNSAKDDFNKDGDFYIVPNFESFLSAFFNVNSPCVELNTPLTFNNLSGVSTSHIFNQISLPGYAGTNTIFAWDFGDGNTSTLENPSHTYTAPGEYQVTLIITQEGWNINCSSIHSIDLSVGLDVAVSLSTDPSCAGAIDGMVSANPNGGAQPYEYNLNGGTWQPNPTFTGLAAGTFTLNIRDRLGCESLTVFSLTDPSPIAFTTMSPTAASCGQNDGALLVNATGGTPPLEFSLDQQNWQPTGVFNNLAGGSYQIYVRDANGCELVNHVGIPDLGGPTITSVSKSNIACNGDATGTISILVTGGTGPYEFSIDYVNWQPLGTFINLPAGVYYAIVRDANLCHDIYLPAPPFGFAIEIVEPPELNVVANSFGVSCHGDRDGSINVIQSTGGTGAHSYSIDGFNWQSNPDFPGLGGGTDNLIVKDVPGCTDTINIVVPEPDELLASLSISPVTCNGGSDGGLQVFGTGGTGDYLYSMDKVHFQNSPNFSNLSGGSYNVTIVDDNGCQYTQQVTIPEPLEVDATLLITNTTCGNSNGQIDITGIGGTGGPYSYSLDGINFQASGIFSNLDDSTYLIIVMDNVGCSKILAANITDSDGPQIASLNVIGINCSDGDNGQINITQINGGTGPYEYSINGSPYSPSGVFWGLHGGQYTITVRDAVGCSGDTSITLSAPASLNLSVASTPVSCFGSMDGTASLQATGGTGNLEYSLDAVNYQPSGSFSGLSPGNYTAIVQDSAGCFGFQTFVVNQPAGITTSLSGLNITCNGSSDGSIIVNASGGTGTLQYSINGTNYQLSSVFPGLSAGPYTVYIKDANDCVETTFTSLIEPSAVQAAFNSTMTTCHEGGDGTIDLSASGGTPGYSYSWSNGTTNEDQSNLYSGWYTVEITDFNGCVHTDSVEVAQPAAPIVLNAAVANATGVAANDGAINLAVTGGVGGYSYEWTHGPTGQNLTGLAPGAYVVTVTDANGCEAFGVYIVQLEVGIDDLEKLGVTVYPNPANNQVIIKSENIMIDQFTIIDLRGKMLKQVKPESMTEQIDISDIAVGTYFIRMEVKGQLITQRLAIVR